jgi:uncharacterized surface protein with fasciclin (FAS1) repeats
MVTSPTTTPNNSVRGNKLILDALKAQENYQTMYQLLMAGPEEVRELLTDAQASLTLFAPDDESWENYLKGKSVEEYAKNAKLLGRQLAHHVVMNRVTRQGLETLAVGTHLPTMAGTALAIQHDGKSIQLDKVDVVVFDIAASNGVIHGVNAPFNGY